MRLLSEEADAVVSVVIPVFNGESFLPPCLESVLNQDFDQTYEVCVFNDGSTDGTLSILETFSVKFQERSVPFRYKCGVTPGGVGFAKNQAVHMSVGKYLCFCDADDVFHRSRVSKMHEAAVLVESPLVFLGSCFARDPPESTVRYTNWANRLEAKDLTVQIYTAHGPTLIAPTWFISRDVFDLVGGFVDKYKRGYPEDLCFFYRAHKLENVKFVKVEDDLVTYRYHQGCATFGVEEISIWNMRVEKIREDYLCRWPKFTIWSAGKQGKRFFKSLTTEEKVKVVSFCDVDKRKLKHGAYEEYDDKTRSVQFTIPIVPIREAVPPVVVCVKMDLTQGGLEALIAETGWTEGVDFIHFG